jgi:hypothetical protein
VDLLVHQVHQDQVEAQDQVDLLVHQVHQNQVEAQDLQDLLVRQDHQDRVEAQDQVVVQGHQVHQEVLAQVGYQETTLLTQVDGVMRQVEGFLAQEDLRLVVQHFPQ